MPTYEYECTKCGQVSELFQSITENPKRALPCGKCKKKTPVRRLIGTGGGIVFKGSGFYSTDYRSESYKKGAEAEKPKAESKPDGEKKEGPAANQSQESEVRRGGREQPAGDTKPAESSASPDKAEKPKPKKPRKD